jgi:hypothetical protein
VLEAMQHYFAAEKAEGLFFMCVGVATLGAGLAFWFRRAFLRGVACPLVAIALIQLLVGGTVYGRTDGQVTALEHQLQTEPRQYRAEELQRMDIVNRNFDRYRNIEMGLLASGIALLAAAWWRRRPTLSGVGLGLALQSALMLVLDFFAEARADLYTAQLLAL